jgi:glycosyltransferase involved in cell wall biosynthesis
VVVVTESTTGKSESVSGIEIIRIPVGKEDWFKKFRVWKSLWQIRKEIENADVIHCHDVFFWYLPFRFFYPAKRVYTTFHGYESYPIKRRAIIMRKISEKLSRGNICIGDFIKKWYGTKPTFVSYGAVDVATENKEQRTKNSSQFIVHSSSLKKESALFFGRLDEQTGILEYVKAVELLKKKYPKFELLVVGDGEYKKRIEKKVKTIGFQKNPEKYFENYHFAFVSRYLSILEAFAAKRLVIATYDNPVKEDYLRMAPYAPFIIIEKEPENIAKRIEELLVNPKQEEKMINQAYKWVQKQTWEEMAKVYLKLWEK